MQRWIASVLGSVMIVLGGFTQAPAQSPSLVGGGLTALPAVSLGSDRLANGGFETLSGGGPASWTTGGGWAMDQLVKHSGTFSYRATGAFSTSSQTLQLRRGTYRLSGWIRTQGVGSGTSNGVRLQFDFRPHTNFWTTTEVISGTRDWTRYELPNLVVSQDATVTIKLENFNNSGGTVWFDDVRLEEQQAQAVDVFMRYPNFRGMLFDDGPATLRFDVAVTPPGGDLSRYRVTGTLRDEATGQVLLSQNYAAAASFEAELTGTLMQHGRPYLVTFSLVDLSTNQAVYTYPAYRVSRVPAGARASLNVAFDERNRVLVRGVPRFVLGVYDSGSSYSTSDAFWENQLWSPTGDRRLDGIKINFYLNYWFGEAPLDAMRALMANLQRRGVMYLQTGNCFDRFAAGNQFNINNSDAYVRDFGAQAGSGGYYTIDECLSSLIPGAFAQYDRLRRLDPDSITFSTNFGNPDLPLWRDVADIVSTDPYPLFGAQPAAGYNHGQVGQWTARTREAVKDARPFMTVLQFFQFTSQGRWPTLAEMRNHAWMAIVEGARGLWWWSLGDNALRNVCSGWCAQKTTYMNNLRAVINEIADLEPALLADDSPGALSGNSNTGAIRTRVKLHNGRGYVFAYNTTNAAASATFTWNTTPGTVTVNAENRTLGASGRSFTDSFGPYQAHVYVVGTGGSGGTGGGGGGTPGAPTVSFVNPPAGGTVSGTATVTLAASGGTGSGYTYRLAVDGASVYTGTNATFGWNTSNTTNGSHTLTATVTDSGNQSGTATRTVTVSNGSSTPPPPPPTGSLTVALTAPVNGATVSGTNWAVVWVNGAGTGSKVYTLSVGGQTVGTTTTSSSGPVSIPWNTAGVANGSQALTASVRDAAGQTGSTSRTVTVSNASGTPTTPLTVGFTSPAAGATVSGTVTVGLTAAGGSGLTYRLAVDGVQVATSAAYSWNTAGVANGSHTLTATVADSAGRTATATRTVTVSNVAAPPPPPPPPTGSLTVALTAPGNGATVSGTNWAVVWVNGAAAGSKVYTLSVGGRTVATSTTASAGPVSIPWNTASVANGGQLLTATVRDAGGRTGIVSRTVTVSNAGSTPAPAPPPPPPPTGTLRVAVTQPTGGATVGGTAWVVMWVEGSSGSSNAFTLSVDGATVGSQTTSARGPVTIPWITTRTSNGSHTLTATVRDATGNTGSSSVTVTVRN
jgi:hypothetical protein